MVPGAVTSLRSNLSFKIAEIPGHNQWSVSDTGSTRFTVAGRRSKEGDTGMRCATRVGATAWPNLMVERGYAESLRMLGLGAGWWLTASGGLTRIVILIYIKKRNPNAIHYET